MKIFFASDLHFDVGAGPGATAALAKNVNSRASANDVLLLGGDYGNTDETVAKCLDLFSAFPGKVLAIAGNHDVWVDTAKRRSEERYRGLSELYRAAGIHPLEDEPIVIDGVGFAGAMGWYDYSFRVESLEVPMEVYRSKGFPGLAGPVWNDGRNVNWGRTDPEFTESQLERLRVQLETLAAAESIVVMTHHVPTDGLLRPDGLPADISREAVIPRQWLILNTYLGSQRFEELLAEYQHQVDMVLCGHIHLSRATERRGITFVSNGSDHKQKELVIYEGGEIVRESFSPG